MQQFARAPFWARAQKGPGPGPMGFYFSRQTHAGRYILQNIGFLMFFRAFSQLRLEKLVWLTPVSGQVDGVESELRMSIFQKHGPEACLGVADFLSFLCVLAYSSS